MQQNMEPDCRHGSGVMCCTKCTGKEGNGGLEQGQEEQGRNPPTKPESCIQCVSIAVLWCIDMFL